MAARSFNPGGVGKLDKRAGLLNSIWALWALIRPGALRGSGGGLFTIGVQCATDEFVHRDNLVLGLIKIRF